MKRNIWETKHTVRIPIIHAMLDIFLLFFCGWAIPRNGQPLKKCHIPSLKSLLSLKNVSFFVTSIMYVQPQNIFLNV